ncbi:uncharacterized protein BP5553_03120 [Venustampulla echinocandica]|uniref:Uncharacterized protein n=1 Tax=Venustampulla echinocandica TaxID=2656787 RepID=A0A370TTC2_9HELO|nr:uncharacterized protein BP5553_03120 [Venustampulla echinocandica]RDL38780.1 hypothetical protein BP5553_03120 [Venustampulla echinocandica]
MADPSTTHSIPSSLANYELDKSHPLTPTHALVVHLPTPLNTHSPSKIEDLTPRLHSLFSPTLGITDGALLSAHKVSNLSPPPPVKYKIAKRNHIGTHLALLDVQGHEIGEWKLPILRHDGGKGQLLFPSGVPGVDEGVKESLKLKYVESTANSGEVTMGSHHGQGKRKLEAFVKNGVVYLWEVDADRHGEGPHKRSLFKVIQDEENARSTKREVASYAQRSTREREGLLVLDGKEVDEIVAVFTLVAMLEASEHFL